MPALRSSLALLILGLLISSAAAEPLAGTKPLTREGDLAAQMVAGIDKYLTRETAGSVEKRKDLWKPDFSSPDAYTKSIQANRERLRKILGVVDERVKLTDIEYVGGPGSSSLVAETEKYRVHAVRWPVFEGVDGEGLLLEPKTKPLVNVVALLDADQTPEQVVGMAPGVAREAQFARRLAEVGCRVIVPVLIDRKDTFSGSTKLNRWTNQPHREFIYRMAYQMGRHIIGYEVQKVLAAVDWFQQNPIRDGNDDPISVRVLGYGEGSLVAFYAAWLDDRIGICSLNGSFGSREGSADEPIYRNVWRLLTEFGDAEMAYGFWPPEYNQEPFYLLRYRWLQINDVARPQVSGPPAAQSGEVGRAPGRLVTPPEGDAGRELDRAKLRGKTQFKPLFIAPDPSAKLAIPPSLQYFMNGNLAQGERADGPEPKDLRKSFAPMVRQKRQFDQLVSFTQKLMRDSEQRRAETFWAKVNTTSLEQYQLTTEPFRAESLEDIIGKLPAPTEPVNARTRQLHDTPKWRSYEVTLDLYPDVYAYGILCVPKDLKDGEKRPVVVCQDGLEGRPSDVVNPKEKTKYYNSFGSDLADRGYVVFAPQNPYIGGDNFRVLQRKANPLGLSLFSFIIRQHERILDWLATQSYVDPQRMAFYGLSYGGKTAMRVPAVLPRYCLSICSGDFNEWTWKNVSVDFRGSYMFTGEYEMPEFNLGNTLVYAEMAALIVAPRPFMVERGHDDGVGIDEWVAYEYAKVRRLYSRLKIPERTTIEFFAGGHEIHSQGTYEFLRKHLQYP